MKENGEPVDSEQGSEITTRVTRKRKPHEKFRATFQFDSMPIQLEVEASKTNVKLQSLEKNPHKFSFGKVPLKGGTIEACMYPEKNLTAALWYFTPNPSTRKTSFSTDLRRIREILNLTRRILYFLSLTARRKREYLRKHGFSANTNTLRGI